MLCIPIALIAVSVSHSEKDDTYTETTSPAYSDTTEECEFVIDIYSWDAIYFRKPVIVGPDLKRYIADRQTAEYIIREKISPSTSICVRRYLNCELSDDELSSWVKEIGITNVIIAVLPYDHEKEEPETLKRLVPLAI